MTYVQNLGFFAFDQGAMTIVGGHERAGCRKLKYLAEQTNASRQDKAPDLN